MSKGDTKQMNRKSGQSIFDDAYLRSSREITESLLNAVILEEKKTFDTMRENLLGNRILKDLVEVILSYILNPPFPQFLFPKQSYITGAKKFLYRWSRWFLYGNWMDNPIEEKSKSHTSAQTETAPMNARDLLHCTFHHFADEDGKWKSKLDIKTLEAMIVWTLEGGLEVEFKGKRYRFTVTKDGIAFMRGALMLMSSSRFMDLIDQLHQPEFDMENLVELREKERNLQLLTVRLPKVLLSFDQKLHSVLIEIETFRKEQTYQRTKQMMASLEKFHELTTDLNDEILSSQQILLVERLSNKVKRQHWNWEM